MAESKRKQGSRREDARNSSGLDITRLARRERFSEAALKSVVQAVGPDKAKVLAYMRVRKSEATAL